LSFQSLVWCHNNGVSLIMLLSKFELKNQFSLPWTKTALLNTIKIECTSLSQSEAMRKHVGWSRISHNWVRSGLSSRLLRGGSWLQVTCRSGARFVERGFFMKIPTVRRMAKQWQVPIFTLRAVLLNVLFQFSYFKVILAVL